MRRLLLLIFICFILTPMPAGALFQKKNYRQMFLNEAMSADKRGNLPQAFHSYEKAIFYYPKDRHLLEDYAQFCERRKYFDKAEKIYEKLFMLTKDRNYLFKRNLCTIKNGKVSEAELKKIIQNNSLNQYQLKELKKALIYHYSYKSDWENVRKTCDSLSKNVISSDFITNCIVAAERKGSKKEALGYYLRYSELYPNNSETVNKIISLSDTLGNYTIQEKFIKKLSALNPKDNGIKYKLAGLYEKQGLWSKAANVYESLMISGDRSEHVKNSYAYVLSQMKNKKSSKKIIFKAEEKTNMAAKLVSQENTKKVICSQKPLSGFKLYEKLFYNAWKQRNFELAQSYLAKMLELQPNNVKLLRHKVDIDVSQNNYRDAIAQMLKLSAVKPLSKDDEKFLAFLYSKTEEFAKAISLIENMLGKYKNDESLLKLALEYSMAAKDWDKAILYNDKLLGLYPKSFVYLKQGADLYSIKKDFANAISYYEKIVEYYPTLSNKKSLANLYMANQDFEKAQDLLEPMYSKHPEDKEIVEAYLNSLLAQQKTKEAYFVVKENNLLKTKEGYMVLGDLAIENKHYDEAGNNYMAALKLAPNSVIYKNKLAFAYRMMGYKTGAAALYNDVLVEDSQNIDAKLGLGSIEIDKKNYKQARKIFYSILKEKPDYKPARIAIAHSYIANDEKLAALDTLSKLEPDDETQMMKAQIYYDFTMPCDSKDTLTGMKSRDAKDLNYKIKKDNAITITPGYSFFFQQLSDQFKLDYHKFNLHLSQNVKANAQVFMDYNVIVYSSGGQNKLYNVVNEFRSGVQGRPNTKWAYRADLGVKAFEFGGGMINTDSWLQYFFNDKFNLKVGYKRDNIEQSYLSAVGRYMDGVFTGRAADNKFYVDFNGKLPHQFYTFGRGAYGIITEQNVLTNQYYEGLIGIGHSLYDNPRNKWIQTVAVDLISYNAGYQYNLLNLYDSTNQLFGNYFSPTYFNADTANFKIEGKIKPWNLKYGIKAFGGIQNAVSPDQTTPTWGVTPYISCDINDHISINALYNHFTYADLVRDQFIINAVIRGFRKHDKT